MKFADFCAFTLRIYSKHGFHYLYKQYIFSSISLFLILIFINKTFFLMFSVLKHTNKVYLE